MKKTLLILVVLVFSMTINAQEVQKQKEVGLTFSNLNNIGLTYKTGNKNSMWRFSTVFINGQNYKTETDSLIHYSFNMSLGFKIGKEFRKSINENFEFRYGLDLGFDYMFSCNYAKSIVYSPSINFVIGANYITKSNVIIGAEIMPFIGYNIRSNDTQGGTTNNNFGASGLSWGVNSTSAKITIGYRF